MRKLCSYLVILLILTAYGRCVADQFGMLHTTTASCCQVICDEANHCNIDGDVGNDTSGNEHSEHQEDSDEQDQPAPCQLCLILSSDSILMGDQLEVPAPIILDITSLSTTYIFCTSPEALIGIRLRFTTPDLTQSDHPDTPAEQRSRLQRIVAKMTPVRGPSIA